MAVMYFLNRLFIASSIHPSSYFRINCNIFLAGTQEPTSWKELLFNEISKNQSFIYNNQTQNDFIHFLFPSLFIFQMTGFIKKQTDVLQSIKKRTDALPTVSRSISELATQISVLTDRVDILSSTQSNVDDNGDQCSRVTALIKIKTESDYMVFEGKLKEDAAFRLEYVRILSVVDIQKYVI